MRRVVQQASAHSASIDDEAMEVDQPEGDEGRKDKAFQETLATLQRHLDDAEYYSKLPKCKCFGNSGSARSSLTSSQLH